MRSLTTDISLEKNRPVVVCQVFFCTEPSLALYDLKKGENPTAYARVNFVYVNRKSIKSLLVVLIRLRLLFTNAITTLTATGKKYHRF